jgi:putative spermidine/putrescine transport system ATP-binding protein
MAFLELRGVENRFGPTIAVDDFNLAAEQGEFIAFLGPSGCGKTTTLRMVAGFEAPTAGRISVGGEDITHRPPQARKLGMVFPNLTVAHNIGFGLAVARQPAAQRTARVSELLRLIDMERLADRYPHQLSGGQQQRVALARALASQPRLLLLDEPLSALDAKIRVSLRQEIRAIQRQLGITTIFVTHDQEEALSLSDRVVVMNAGRIEQIGTPHEIYNRPATRFVASFVGTLNVLDANVLDAAQGRLAVDGQAVVVAGPITGARPDTPVALALRPEALRLVAGTDGAAINGDNVLRGTVEDLSFLGAVVQLRVRLREHTLLCDTFNDPQHQPPSVGAPVAVSFRPESALVLQ